MIKLSPLQYDKIWGYERWIASVHPDGCQKEFLNAVGKDYPLLVKVIQADEYLSVQVHPDDFFAEKFEGKGVRGKTECWYVLDAKPGAKLVYGLKDDYSKAELKRAIEVGKLESYLNYVNVGRGDFIFIPAGTVHAIGGGLRLLEVQQSCNTTYRLYDWNRGRELHIEKGLEVIKNNERLPIRQFDCGEFSCDYFRLVRKNTDSEFLAEAAEKPKLLFCLKSEGAEILSGGNRVPFLAEQIIALNPNEKVKVHGKAELMEIEIP